MIKIATIFGVLLLNALAFSQTIPSGITVTGPFGISIPIQTQCTNGFATGFTEIEHLVFNTISADSSHETDITVAGRIHNGTAGPRDYAIRVRLDSLCSDPAPPFSREITDVTSYTVLPKVPGNSDQSFMFRATAFGLQGNHDYRICVCSSSLMGNPQTVDYLEVNEVEYDRSFHTLP